LVTIAKIKNIIKISYPIGLGLLFVFAYDKIDVLIITIYKGTREGGTYYAAYAIMKSFTILTSFYLIKYFSHLSNYYNKDKAIYKQLVLQSLTISFVIAISLIAGFQFYSAQIIKLFFGNSFINSGPLLKILSFAIFFMIINYNLGTILNSMDRFNAPMVGGVISLFVNVTLNLLFVPKYGYYASSYITIVTEITMLCYYLFEFLRLYNKKILNG
jgi:O-antigen/teichoic acid export membrane protein